MERIIGILRWREHFDRLKMFVIEFIGVGDGNSVFAFGPLTEVDQLAAFGTKWAIWIVSLVLGFLLAAGAFDLHAVSLNKKRPLCKVALKKILL